MKHFLDITTQGNALQFITSLDDSVLTVYSPTSLELAGVPAKKLNMINSHALRADAELLKEFCASRRYSAVVSIGGGTAIDIGKYAATLYGCTFTCIPTMLSTNAYATNKAALMSGGAKMTFDAKMANKIIFDAELIRKAKRCNVYGLCDVLSIHTALFDWRLAEKIEGETVDTTIYDMAQALLQKSINYILGGNSNADTLDLIALYKLVGESGHITNLHGNGRPESGSEHIFAREVERRTQVPHGISVAAGIVLMSLLQGNYSTEIVTCLNNLGVLIPLRSDDLQNVLTESLCNIQPRSDRFTILSQRLPMGEEIDELLNKLYETSRQLDGVA